MRAAAALSAANHLHAADEISCRCRRRCRNLPAAPRRRRRGLRRRCRRRSCRRGLWPWRRLALRRRLLGCFLDGLLCASSPLPSAIFFFLAGAAFFFFADFFFAFDFFAMIVLPISLSPFDPCGLPTRRSGETVNSRRHGHEPTQPAIVLRVHRRRRPMLPQLRRTRPPGGPIDQLDRMDDRKFRARCDLRDAADIACCNHIRSQSFDSPDFALAQPPCDVGLQNIVGPGRAAAQMTVRNVLHREAELGEKLLRLTVDALAVLQRTGGMIGDGKPGARSFVGLSGRPARYSEMSLARPAIRAARAA